MLSIVNLPGLLGKSELFTSDDIIQSDVLRTMLDLICSLKHKSQLAGLGVLAGLAMTSAEMAKKLLSPKLHQVTGFDCLFRVFSRPPEAEA